MYHLSLSLISICCGDVRGSEYTPNGDQLQEVKLPENYYKIVASHFKSLD